MSRNSGRPLMAAAAVQSLEQDLSSAQTVPSSNAVDDAFLAFHRRQQRGSSPDGHSKATSEDAGFAKQDAPSRSMTGTAANRQRPTSRMPPVANDPAVNEYKHEHQDESSKQSQGASYDFRGRVHHLHFRGHTGHGPRDTPHSHPGLQGRGLPPRGGGRGHDGFPHHMRHMNHRGGRGHRGGPFSPLPPPPHYPPPFPPSALHPAIFPPPPPPPPHPQVDRDREVSDNTEEDNHRRSSHRRRERDEEPHRRGDVRRESAANDRRDADQPRREEGRESRSERIGFSGRGRGRGRAGGAGEHYDAEFDRGKSAEEKRAEKAKQLFHAPMRYKTELQEKRDNDLKRPQIGSTERSVDIEKEGKHVEVVNGLGNDIGVMSIESTKETAGREVVDPGPRPGIIQTGVDLSASSARPRDGRHKGGRTGEQNGRGRRADVRVHSHNRSPSRDSQLLRDNSSGGPVYLSQSTPDLPGNATTAAVTGTLLRPRGSLPGPEDELTLPNAAKARRLDGEGRGRGYTESDELNGNIDGRTRVPLRRDSLSRDSHVHTHKEDTSPNPASRQLFDPRKDDPVKFSALKSSTSSQVAGLSGSDAKSVASASTRTSVSSLSIASSSYRSRHADHRDALMDEVESTSSGAGSNALLRELKASYRQILSLEAKLQDEDALSKASMQETEREQNLEQKAKVMDRDKDDAYWVELIQLHRQTAEAFHSFMNRCMDPLIPISLHSIPQKYNLPQRLWSTAFLLLFIRLQAAVTSNVEESTSPERTGQRTLSGDRVNHILDHLTDFIYYAYTFYTHLLEQQSLVAFRSIWLEQLGEVAQQRMYVAGLQLTTVPAAEVALQASSALSLASLLSGADEDIPNVYDTADKVPKPEPESIRGTRMQLVSRKDRKKGFVGIKGRALPNDMEQADTPGNSIGAAAINDWDLVEENIWKSVAGDWFFLGLSETPGTGRMHYRLASLMPQDELRTLYHLVKSVAASHAFAPAQEALHNFFQQGKQAKRDLPGASAVELFIHLHGVMYTDAEVEDFDALCARFVEKLNETFAVVKALAGKSKRRSAKVRERDDVTQGLAREATWIIFGVISIASMMEYGREDASLKSALLTERGEKRNHAKISQGRNAAANHHSTLHKPSALGDFGLQEVTEGLAGATLLEHSMDTRHSKQPSRRLSRALKLVSLLLAQAFSHPMRPEGLDPAISPFITTILTFSSVLAACPPALMVVQPFLPWKSMVDFMNTVPTYAVEAFVSKDAVVPNRLLGIPLPEDWCIRGMAWTGKQLFGRGYWKGKQGSAYYPVSRPDSTEGSGVGTTSYSIPESEKDVLAETYEGPAMPAHAGGPARSHPDAADGDRGGQDEDGDPPTDRETLARLRWMRVALCAAWFSRSLPYISVNTDTEKLELDVELLESMIQEGASFQSRFAPQEAGSSEATMKSSVDDGNEDSILQSGDENDTVKELKERRRELEALLRETRESRQDKASQSAFGIELRDGAAAPGTYTHDGQGRNATGSTVQALAGYTTLVFDTNVLLEAMDIFTSLLTSKRWKMVVPLAVVTELDGLRMKSDALGSSANQAIRFLEDSIKTYGTNLKVQTSKGNYLRDLTIRHEDIDFGHKAAWGSAGSSDSRGGSMRSMDDVILNVGVWQKQHWLDRRALLGMVVPSESPQGNVPGKLNGDNGTATSTVRSDVKNPIKVILVSNDRTLRLKGRARGLDVCEPQALEGLLEQMPNG